MLDIPCVIFAGGKSSRMGEDKTLLPFAGFTTLTEFQYSKLSKIFKNVYISCKDSSKFSFDANYILDKKNNECFAPTLAFISIFEHLKSDSFFALSVDSPFIDEETILKILSCDSEMIDAVVAETEVGIQPLCGVYHRSLLPAFNTMLQEKRHKLTFLLKNSNTNYVSFKDDNIFLNLNHKREYQKALQLLTHY